MKISKNSIERTLAIAVIVSVILATIIATVVSTVVTFYPEVGYSILNLF